MTNSGTNQDMKSVNVISDIELAEMYAGIFHDLNKHYIEGTFEYIRKKHEKIDTQMNEQDNKINKLWLLCLDGKATFDDFQSAVNDYRTILLKAIRLRRFNL